MSEQSLLDAIAPWLALGLVLIGLVLSITAALSRTVFVAVVMLTGVGVCVGAATALLSDNAAAMAILVFYIAWMPIALIACALLTGRVVKAAPRMRFIAPVTAALIVFGAMCWAAPQIATPMADISEISAPSAWLAFIVVAVGLGCVGLLGYGERGALTQNVIGSDR